MLKRGRNSKIIATLGPASSSLEIIESLYRAGADVFRLNFSHADHDHHKTTIEHIRTLQKNHNSPIGIIADLQGPKLRIGTFTKASVDLHKNQTFELHLSPIDGDTSKVQLPHPEIFEVATRGTELLLDDGKIRLRVEKNDKAVIQCTVIVGGKLSSKKGVNVPGVHLPLSAMTEKDRRDLAFALDHDIEWIALSFVQKPQDIEEAKALVQGKAKVISKLEKPLAIQYLNDIVEASDAIMVARGDLGVELPIEEVPTLQKKIIRACRSVGKPVIVATQMLESMINTPTPTRAEASDVANAIYDHVDCVMLSAESASGQYPLESVQMMHRLITHTERDIQSDYQQLKASSHQTVSDAITAAAREITQHLNVKAIVTLTQSGNTTYAAAKERPYAPLIALTQNEKTARELCLCWGAYPFLVKEELSGSIDHLATSIIVNHNFAQKGERIILTSGTPFKKGSTNMLKILEIDSIG